MRSAPHPALVLHAIHVCKDQIERTHPSNSVSAVYPFRSCPFTSIQARTGDESRQASGARLRLQPLPEAFSDIAHPASDGCVPIAVVVAAADAVAVPGWLAPAVEIVALLMWTCGTVGIAGWFPVARRHGWAKGERSESATELVGWWGTMLGRGRPSIYPLGLHMLYVPQSFLSVRESPSPSRYLTLTASTMTLVDSSDLRIGGSSKGKEERTSYLQVCAEQ